MKYIIKINFTCFFFPLFNVATRKCKVPHVAPIIFLLDSTGLLQGLANNDLRPVHSLDFWFRALNSKVVKHVLVLPRGAKDNCWIQEENAKTSIHLYLFYPLKYYIFIYLIIYHTAIDYM